MPQRLEELKARLIEINDIHSANAVLRWDQTTYMPPRGADSRGRQMATLSRIAHDKFVEPALGRLLEQCEKEVASLSPDSDQAALVRVTRREYDLAVKVPGDLVSEFSSHTARIYQEWTEARPANDFARLRPLLEKTLDLSRKLANCFPGYECIADPLIDYNDFGARTSTIRAVFGELRQRLVPLVRAIAQAPPADDRCLSQRAPAEKQLAFGTEVIRRYGYDFERGRQDITHHPYMTRFASGDIRITTRVRDEDITDSLFSTLHEAGHALYELGIDPRYDGTPLAAGTSAGAHESQSRLWENLVGRSSGFWSYFYPRLQEYFPEQLRSVPLETFYRAINKVQPSLIRTDADEVTYNLHVMIRFDLELDMLEGRLAIKDLPETWRSRYQEDLGVTAPDDRDGVLQDVHWYSGMIGGVFQGYTLGNIMSAQYFEAAVRAKPSIPQEIARGEFATLHAWLEENLYRHGAKYTADEVIRRATGSPMTIEAYMRYLWQKYQPLYGLREEDRAAVTVGA